ncbi:hypothetical protein TIFTF001_047361 [Ficus carica]|uniref:Uncharacterized protein n=1 Tax=Ficus carica TaxID=3494 RepID=A0AA88CMA7_FICCA|nr:hypothetical protein TIFTF001_047346 [Ficus carica]GMN21993.1 hypothetical protein TIFTF001_047351 [Ficus carica]GMN22012.1 hypothetical protein TIFTF001_047356 [Ficus carica]GMN22031.1 hypothetical protein TIFTF001_047361 [Ficus carica]
MLWVLVLLEHFPAVPMGTGFPLVAIPVIYVLGFGFALLILRLPFPLVAIPVIHVMGFGFVRLILRPSHLLPFLGCYPRDSCFGFWFCLSIFQKIRNRAIPLGCYPRDSFAAIGQFFLGLALFGTFN